MKRSTWALFAVSIVAGVVIISVGFRVTDEVTPIVGALILTGFLFGFIRPDRAWLWGIGVGIGTRIVPEPPLSAAHVAKEGASQPLPLPFGLTHDPIAQWVASSLLIMAFPFVGASLGWLIRTVSRLK